MCLLIFLTLFVNFVNSEYCVCTTVSCPEVGSNHIVMGNGNANMYYYYINRGEFNVILSANGTINTNSLDNGSETTSCTQKYSRLLEDDRKDDCDAGHILANRLGGYGNEPLNIFPQDPSINRGSYKTMESQIYDCMIEDNIGYLSWNFYYDNSTSTKPNKVHYAAYFDNYCDKIDNIFSN